MSIICLTRGMSLIGIGVIRARMSAKFCVFVENKPLTLYLLPKLHKRPHKSRFIANRSSFTTIELPMLITSGLTAIKPCYKIFL